MKILKQAKLIVLIPLVTLAFACESKEVDKPEIKQSPEEKNATTEKKVIPLSLLRQQIQIMLAGEAHNEAILKTEVGKQEWKATFAILKEELEKYTAQHGKRPEKKYIARSHALLSKLRAEVDLELTLKKKKEALEDLENTIKQAIKDEKTKKPLR